MVLFDQLSYLRCDGVSLKAHLRERESGLHLTKIDRLAIKSWPKVLPSCIKLALVSLPT